MNNQKNISIFTMFATAILGIAIAVLPPPVKVYAQNDKITALSTGDIADPRARKVEVFSDELSPEEFYEYVENVPKRRALYSFNNCYYYNQLNDVDKLYYNAILEASVKNIGASKSFSKENSVLVYTGNSYLAQPNWIAIFNAIEFDHPEQLESTLFGVRSQHLTTKENGVTKNAYYIYFTPDSAYTVEQIADMESTLQSSLDSFFTGLTLTGDDADKELIIHDALVDAVVYDSECANYNIANDVAHTAYGALVEHSAVCDGYSTAFKMLLNKAGIESEVVPGLANGGGHAWNVVKIDNSWYETDVTWDDQPDYTGNKYYFLISHEYFNLTTADIESHSVDIHVAGPSTTTHVQNVDYLGYLEPPVAYGTTYSYRNIKQVYKIIFNGTIDEATVSPSKAYTYKGKVIEMPSSQSLYGYTFDNWYTEETGGNIVSSDTDFTKSSIVYARWIPVTVNVHFYKNDGSTEYQCKDAIYDSSYENVLNSLDTFTWNDHTFVGWFTKAEGGNEITARTVVKTTDTICVYAHWEKNASEDHDGSQSKDDPKDDNSENNETQSDASGHITDGTTSTKKGLTVIAKGASYVVTGTKEVAYKGTKNNKAEVISIPSSIKINGTDYKVTEVSPKAFRKKVKIKKVTIGKNVTKIGAQAFEGCTALTTVNGAKSVRSIGTKAFNGCVKLRIAPIGSKVISIENMAFYNCKALTSMTIPSNVNKLGKYFAGKTPNLKTLTVKTKNLKAKGVINSAFTRMGNNRTVITVPKGKIKSYQSLFQTKGLNKKIKLKKIN